MASSQQAFSIVDQSMLLVCRIPPGQLPDCQEIHDESRRRPSTNHRDLRTVHCPDELAREVFTALLAVFHDLQGDTPMSTEDILANRQAIIATRKSRLTRKRSRQTRTKLDRIALESRKRSSRTRLRFSRILSKLDSLVENQTRILAKREAILVSRLARV